MTNPTPKPSDSVMVPREAFEHTLNALKLMLVAVKDEPAMQARKYVQLGIQVNEAIDKAEATLTAAPLQGEAAPLNPIEAEPVAWRQSEEAMRIMIAREIWRYQECPWDFDAPDGMMAELQKQLAVDQADLIRKVICSSKLFKAYFSHQATQSAPVDLDAPIPKSALAATADDIANDKTIIGCVLTDAELASNSDVSSTTATPTPERLAVIDREAIARIIIDCLNNSAKEMRSLKRFADPRANLVDYLNNVQSHAAYSAADAILRSLPSREAVIEECARVAESIADDAWVFEATAKYLVPTASMKRAIASAIRSLALLPRNGSAPR